MKLYNVKSKSSSISYAGVLEKVEILSSTLRWAPTLERPEIQKLLAQCNALRDEVMQLSHKERFVQASTGKRDKQKGSEAERRQALVDRSFVFEGVFGANPKLLEALEVAEKAKAGFDRTVIGSQIVAIQWISHFQTKGVAGTQTAGFGASGNELVPAGRPLFAMAEILEAVFACVSGPADEVAERSAGDAIP